MSASAMAGGAAPSLEAPSDVAAPPADAERTASGLLVPGNVRVFAAGAKTETIRLGVSFDEDDQLAFDLDVEVDPKVFSPPARGS